MEPMKGGLSRFWENRHQTHSLRGIGFADLSEEFNHWIWKAKERAVERAVAACEIRLGHYQVLDVGSGTGYWIEWFRRAGAASVVGVDISKTAVDHLKDRFRDDHRVKLAQLDATEEGMSAAVGGNFQLVNVLDVSYHILDNRAFDRFLQNVCDAVAVGGFVFLSDCFDAREKNPGYMHRFRSLSEYAPALEQNNISLRCLLPTYFLLGPPLALRNWYVRNAMRYAFVGSALALDRLSYLIPLVFSADSQLTKVEGFRIGVSLLVAQKTEPTLRTRWGSG